MASINDVRSLDNPQRAYEFEVEVLGGSSAGSDIPIITQRVENVTIPSVEVETIEINYKNSKTIHSGRDSSPHTLTISFYDSESREVYTYFMNWMKAIRNPDGNGGDTRDAYAGSLLVKTFAADSSTVTGTNRFTKVFPTSIGDVSLSYESSEHMKFDVTFSYDENLVE